MDDRPRDPGFSRSEPDDLEAFFRAPGTTASAASEPSGDGAHGDGLPADDLEAFFSASGGTASSTSGHAHPAASELADDDLAAFFASPDARHAAAARSRGTAPSRGRMPYVAPGQNAPPSAPPPPTGPAAERRRRTGRVLAVLLGLVVLGGVAAVAVVAWLSQSLPSFEQIENPQNYLATQVLSADNVELARYYDGENRTWVSLDDMNPLVPQALIATEDRRFYQHWGLDMQALAAVAKDIVTGRGARGASTITMQLARNLYREQVQFTVGDRSIVRKAKEILTAVRIERTYTKREILEAYLNTVPFLYNAYGIEAAAQTFFSKPAADLDASEAATLIGMLAANTTYNPCGGPDGAEGGCGDDSYTGPSRNPAARERRDVVLANMRRMEVLDASAYEAARDAPIRLAFNPYNHEDNIAPHFAEVLRLWLRDWIKTRPECQGADSAAVAANPNCNIYTAGLVVRTTIDSRMQALATEAVREEMNDLQAIVNRGWGGTSEDGFQYWWRRNTAVVNEYIGQSERYTERAGRPWSGRQADLDPAVLNALRDDTAFMDSLRRARTRVEAGLVAIEPASGHVKAWVGGRDFVANKFDHGGQARRQPGSTFKLFAYTAAFHNGYSPQATAVDLPFAWGDWRPQNSGGGYAGVVSLASALAASRNIVAARITQHFGQAEIARTAYQMGTRSILELVPENLVSCQNTHVLSAIGKRCTAGQREYRLTSDDAERIRARNVRLCPAFAAMMPAEALQRATGLTDASECYPRSIALGTQDLSLVELTAAYATVANYGVYHGPTIDEARPSDSSVPPHIVLAVDRIEDRYGNVVADFTPVAREVLNPSTAYTVFDAMRGVIRSGTGRGLGGYRGATSLDVAGKTGTTQENADGWFVGMTPQLVVGSWTGFDDRRITYPSTSVGQGGRTGLRNVGAFLSRLVNSPDSTLRLDPDTRFEKPENFQPPTRAGRIGRASYLPGSRVTSRSARQRGASATSRGESQTRIEREGSRPARDLLRQFEQRGGGGAPAAPPAEPRPQSQGGGSTGRIGW